MEFAGRATANLSGVGTFEVISTADLHCSGTYYAFSRAKPLVVAAKRVDGRPAQIEATRNKDKASGFGTITLSDGTAGTFQFGKGY